MKVIFCRLLFLLVITSTVVYGQGRSGNFALSKGDLIENLLFSYYDELEFNGSVLVVENNQIIYENTFGFADFENEEPLDADLPFYLASLGKQFTAAAIIKLEEEGKLSLDDHIKKYLPMMPKIYEPIKIHHLLTHTAGVPDYINNMNIARPGLTNMDVYRALIKQRNLQFTPGNKFRYSNSGYILLAMIVQVASGQTIENYFQEQIFDVFQMDNAFVYSTATANRQRVKGYSAKKKLNDYNLMTVGDGGIYASARDLYKWEQALNTGKFINKESLDRIYTQVVLTNGRSRRYGFGWEIGSNSQGKLVYHDGELAGFRTYMERQLESGNAVIILTNNSFSQVANLRNMLVKILDGRVNTLPEEK
jgi:CubicO group peptidase (beta-lactamase class C family)